MMSFYQADLTLSFRPYIGKDYRGLSNYCHKTFLSMAITYEGAALFFITAMRIIDGRDSDKQIQAMFTRVNGATLTFEYKPDENNQMTAYLVIDKNNLVIPFRFSTHTYQVKENGQMVTKIMQSGLIAFVKVLEGYLTGVGSDNHVNKLGDEVEK